MDAKQCRFCLDDGETPDNPLIEPCPCSGSIRYVHLLCLRRWAAIDPANGEICDICKSPFTLPVLEVLPIRSTTVVFLENGALIGSALIYFTPVNQVRAVHLMFQVTYLLGLANIFHVQNLRGYTNHQIKRSLPLIVTYAALLYRLLQHNDLACCFFINIVLFLSWMNHIRVLQVMNV